MSRALVLFLIMLLVAPFIFAESPATGTWDCVSNAGVELKWTLTVKDDGGKLSGTLVGGPDEHEYTLSLIDPKLDGNIFTFKFYINPQCTMRTKVQIDGKKFEGTFGCEDATTGTLKGVKRS